MRMFYFYSCLVWHILSLWCVIWADNLFSYRGWQRLYIDI